MTPPETALPEVARGEIWLVNFEPQTHKEEPGKRERPALVIQTNLLNKAGHKSTLVIPGTTDVYRDEKGDGFPLRVPIGAITGKDTDLLIDQIRAISNSRLMGTSAIATLSLQHMKRVEEAVKIILR